MVDSNHLAPSAGHPEHPAFWRSRYAMGLFVMGAIAAYLLLSEHRAHFIGVLPLLLLLACPLMHVFMHNGHGGHGRHGGSHADRTDAGVETPAPAAQVAPKLGEPP